MFAPPGPSPAVPAARAAAPARAQAVRASELRLQVGFADAAERERIVAWLDAGLRPDRPGRLAREYPHLIGAGARALPLTLFEGRRPVAFCALLPACFELAAGPLRSGLISLVYTDPERRGQGHAGRLLERAVAEARERALGVCLLWSELDDFYRDRGFTRAGAEALLVVDAATLAAARRAGEPASAFAVRAAQAADWPAIEALRNGRACRLPLDGLGETLAGLPDLAVRVAHRPDSGGAIAGFAMRGRGDDFAGVVHEWGGEPDAVLRCCEALLPADAPDPGLLLLAPRSKDALAWRLRSAGARVVAHPLAWFRLASPAAFAADLAALVPGFPMLAATESAAGAATDERTATLDVVDRGTGRRTAIAQADLLHAVFGDVDEATGRAALARLAPLLPEAAGAALPLPFFVSGLESV